MLFGHQNDDTKSAVQAAASDTATTSMPVANALAPDPLNLPALPDEIVQDATPSSSALNQASTTDPLATPTLPTPEPALLEDPATQTNAASDDAPAATVPASDLLELKQQALEQLGPLVGHLEQSPEERFRTTMMMIQSSDNQGLIQTAYDAAQAITDEKARAQALLDVINEINYFTQKATNA